MLCIFIIVSLIAAIYAAPMASFEGNDSVRLILAPQEDEKSEDGLTPISRAAIALICLFAFFIALHAWQYYTFRPVSPVMASHGSDHTIQEDEDGSVRIQQPYSDSEDEFVDCTGK